MSAHEERDPMEARLDELGAAERAAASGSFEDELGSDAAALARLDASLAALAAAESGSAPDGLEARLLDTVADEFAPAPIRFARAHRVGIIGGLGLAAAVTLAVGLLGVLAPPPAHNIGHPTITAAALEDDVDFLLDLYEEQAWESALAELRTETDSLDDGLDDPWVAYDTLLDPISNGAS